MDTTAAFYFVPDGEPDEFENPIKEKNIRTEDLNYWRLKENIIVPSSKIMLAGLGSTLFQECYDQTLFELRRNPAFYGMAAHYYETYRDLLKN